jgi:uncharacterized protein (TIGR00290 family)
MLPRALISWSSGKDSAWALQQVHGGGAFDIVGVLTTITQPYGRVSMHGVREAVLLQQVERIGLPLFPVYLPVPCSNQTYQAHMAEVLATCREQDITHVIFGDLFLEDVRAYREAQMREAGMMTVFPLWRRDTAQLAREMLAQGMEATITVVDPTRLGSAFAGRSYDAALLDDLPESVDPCGERGEFHTVVTDGPMFSSSIPVDVGEVVEREGFVFADVVLKAECEVRCAEIHTPRDDGTP